MTDLDRAHLDALHVLIEPLKEAWRTSKPITPLEAKAVLNEWDRARKVVST